MVRICVGKRGLPCLFRKWLRTEGTWRIRGIPLDGWELWGGGWMWWGQQLRRQEPMRRWGLCLFYGAGTGAHTVRTEPTETGRQEEPAGRENVSLQRRLSPFLLAGVATSHQHTVGLGVF